MECSGDGPSEDPEKLKVQQISQGLALHASTTSSRPEAKTSEARVAKSNSQSREKHSDGGSLSRRLTTPKRVRRLPNKEELFSDMALWERAEQAVEQSVRLTIANVPSVTNYPHPFGGGLQKLRLASMSKEAQQTFLRVARYDAEALLEEAKKRHQWDVKVARRHKQVSGKLGQWYEKKQQAEYLWQQHEEKFEREKAKKKRLEIERWKKRSEELHLKLADMTDERETSVLYGEVDREKQKATEKKKQDAVYHQKQKKKLEAWRKQKLCNAEDQHAFASTARF